MKLRQATRCAIWICVHLASQPNRHISAAELAEIYGISQHHLAKVIRTLSIARLVYSTRGPGGGCTFIANPRKVTLMRIIELFEFDLEAENQTPPATGEENYIDEVARILGEIDHIAHATLDSVTLETIIQNAARRRRRLDEKTASAVSVAS